MARRPAASMYATLQAGGAGGGCGSLCHWVYRPTPTSGRS
jgi:hypothetical protein